MPSSPWRFKAPSSAPAKYGVIPELVPSGRIAGANAILNLLTNIAVIVGMVVAGPICESFTGDGASRWPALAVMLAVAVLGFGASLFMPRLKAIAPKTSIRPATFQTYGTAIAHMRNVGLLRVATSWGMFYFIGTMGLLIVPEYEHVLGISKTTTSSLMGGLGLSVGVGCLLAGWLSGRRDRPILVTIGTAGMAASFGLLAFFSTSLPIVIALLLFSGVSAGLFVIPLQSMLQRHAPERERGRFLATANAISFTFMTVAGGLYALVRDAFPIEKPQLIFMIPTAAAIGMVGVQIVRPLRAPHGGIVIGRAGADPDPDPDPERGDAADDAEDAAGAQGGRGSTDPAVSSQIGGAAADPAVAPTD